ncbi:MAG TPA: DsbA family oxidoreductase [Acetobacteraceae bacterium]
MRLDVLSDPICPWCHIGRRHMQAALAELAGQGMRFTVAWRPFQLNPDMPVGGMPREDYRRAKFGSLERSRELDAQVAAAAAAAGLTINFAAMRRTPNTLAAHRLIRFAGPAGLQDEVVGRLFEDYFVNGRDLGNPAVLADAAAACGLDRPAVAEYLSGDTGSAEIRSEDQALRSAGVQGVPTFVLDDHMLFSGAVAAPAFAERLGRACRILEARQPSDALL